MNDSDDIQQLATILSEQKDTKGRKRFYKALSDEHRAEEVSADVRIKTQQLIDATARPKVDFSDLADVRRRTERYLRACAESGTFPSVLGLANFGLGISRRTLNHHLQTHPDSASSQFLEVAKDTIANIVSTAALGKNADSVMSIFLMKNLNGFTDTVQIEPVQQPILGRQMTAEEIQAKYQDLIED